MKFDAQFGDAEAVQLKAAILLYGGAKRVTFASVHEPCRDPEAARRTSMWAGRSAPTFCARWLAGWVSGWRRRSCRRPS